MINKNLWFALFSLAFLMSSCNKEDQNNHELHGNWNLISAQCCTWPKKEYTIGDVKWNINMNEHTIHITHNDEMEQDIRYYFEEGSYTVQTEDNEINIDYKGENNNFNYLVFNDTLSVHKNFISDGYSLIFIR